MPQRSLASDLRKFLPSSVRHSRGALGHRASSSATQRQQAQQAQALVCCSGKNQTKKKQRGAIAHTPDRAGGLSQGASLAPRSCQDCWFRRRLWQFASRPGPSAFERIARPRLGLIASPRLTADCLCGLASTSCSRSPASLALDSLFELLVEFWSPAWSKITFSHTVASQQI
jgi:hypothetical protein